MTYCIFRSGRVVQKTLALATLLASLHLAMYTNARIEAASLPLIKPPISLVVRGTQKLYGFSPELFDGTPETGRIGLTATIQNVSSSPVTVSTFADTVINVRSISYRRAQIA